MKRRTKFNGTVLDVQLLLLKVMPITKETGNY